MNPFLIALRDARNRALAGLREEKPQAIARYGLTHASKRAARGKTRVIKPQNWGVRGSF